MLTLAWQSSIKMFGTNAIRHKDVPANSLWPSDHFGLFATFKYEGAAALIGAESEHVVYLVVSTGDDSFASLDHNDSWYSNSNSNPGSRSSSYNSIHSNSPEGQTRRNASVSRALGKLIFRKES